MWGIRFYKVISQLLFLLFFINSTYANTILPDTTENKKPIVLIESVHNVIVKWRLQRYNFFTIGTCPRGTNILKITKIENGQYNTGGHSFASLKKHAELQQTTFNQSTPFYITLNKGLPNEWDLLPYSLKKKN